jgi:hypothetical protein
MVPMAAHEHLVKSYDIRGCPAPTLSRRRVQQIAICATVQGAIVTA